MAKRIVIEPIEDELFAHIVNAVTNSFDGTASQTMPEDEQAKAVGHFLFDTAAAAAKKHASDVGQRKAAIQIESYADSLIIDAKQMIVTKVESVQADATPDATTQEVPSTE